MAREDRDTRGKTRNDFPTRKIITTPIRLSYPYLFDARENDQGAEYWETEALIPPTKEGDALRAEILAGLEDVMTEAFGHEDEWPRGRNDYHPADKLKYVDPQKIPGPGIDEDWTIFRARSYQPPGVVDANKDEVLNKREVYGGRWARLSITLAAYDSKKSKGVTIYLNNVQLLDNAESFGGRPNADSDFDRWDGEELEPGGRRERDRDDRGSDRVSSGRGRDREDARSGRDRGRGDGGRARDDGRGGDRARARADRDEGDQDQHDTRRGRVSRGVDERDTDRDARDADRRRDNRVSDRDRGADRDRSDREAPRDRGRAGRGDDDRRGGGRDDRGAGRGREDDRDADPRSDRGRGSRDDRDDDRGSRRGRDRDDDDQDDRRPSRRGRDDDDQGDDDWS
jgi:hypothetical protein